MMSAMKLPSRRQAQDGSLAAWQPMPAWSWMLAAVAVLIVTAGVIIWLLAIAGGAKPGTDRANSRLDAVRTGLAAGAAVGAAAGLFLAFRRQHHQEVATKSSDHDAIERRITELYTKAVEQLGSDKAPVRLGGLYALERLAQDNPAHQQTIVDVICAYLRMPFSATPPASKPEPEAAEDSGEHGIQPETTTDEDGDTWRQERQVRLTAQRILADHLRDERPTDQGSTDPPSLRFWPDIRLDLVDATLINLDLRSGVMADADFTRAVFSGYAFFNGATFRSRAAFDGATFTSIAHFASMAQFAGVTFSRHAGFIGATFSDEATFHGADFNGMAAFAGTTFSGEAGFIAATFRDVTVFAEATFGGSAVFHEATFRGSDNSLSFHGSRVLSPDAYHVWPAGWCLGPDGSGGYTVVRANDDASQPIPGDGSDGSRS